MECPECKSNLIIADSEYAAENDDTPDTPTEIYSVLTMVCINPKCGNYCGTDLNNPLKITQTIKNKVN
jgi:hypothetical protein